MPTTGPASIPDDTLEKHTLRSETSTYNLTVGKTGSGLLVLFPGYPGSVVGAHYQITEEGALHFDQMLRTAQSLPASYNYCRLVSRSMTVRSSTLPGGVYALNGTLNAVTFHGSLSEIVDTSYNGLMSATANITDKVGNVLVGEGVTVLSLPTSYDLPFVRLGDPIPCIGADPTLKATCDSSDRPRTYVINLMNEFKFSGAEKEESSSVMLIKANIDALASLSVTGQISIMGKVINQKITMTMIFFGLNGKQVVAAKNICVEQGITMNQYDIIPVNMVLSTNEIEEPITSVMIEAETVTGGSKGDPLSWVATGDIAITVHGGNYPGSLRPVTLVAYERVAEGSVLTVAGVSNFELIPNPELSKNLLTEYGRFDPAAMNYTKLVLSQRDRLGIRSVWPTREYTDFRDYFLEIADLSAPLKIAGAWGFKDLIRTIRKAVVPAVSALFPAAAPIATAIGTGVDYLLGDEAKAASGVARAASGVARAASGKPRAGTLRQMTMASDLRNMFAVPARPTVDGILASPGALRGAHDHSMVVAEGMTLFPVIIMSVELDGTPSAVHSKMFAVVRGHRPELQPMSQRSCAAITLSGKKVYGYMSGTQLPITTSEDYTVIPVDDVWDDMVLRSTDNVPPITGNSGNLAIKYMDSIRPAKPVQIAMTGALNAAGKIEPISFGTTKLATAHRMGLKLAGPGKFDINTGDCWSTFINRFPENTTAWDRIPYATLPFLAPPSGRRYKKAFAASEFKETPELEEFAAAMMRASQADPLFEAAARIFMWLEDNNLVAKLDRFIAADPDGQRMRNVLDNAPTAGSKSQRAKYGSSGYGVEQRGPTQEEAQAAKDERLASRMETLGIYFATPEWIALNGHRGPSPGQLKYWQNTREIPDPMEEYTEYIHAEKTRLASEEQILRAATSIYGAPQQAKPPQEFIDEVAKVYELNGGRGPNQDQMADLRIAAAALRRRRPQARPKPKPPEPSNKQAGRLGRWIRPAEEEELE